MNSAVFRRPSCVGYAAMKMTAHSPLGLLVARRSTCDEADGNSFSCSIHEQIVHVRAHNRIYAYTHTHELQIVFAVSSFADCALQFPVCRLCFVWSNPSVGTCSKDAALQVVQFQEFVS